MAAPVSACRDSQSGGKHKAHEPPRGGTPVVVRKHELNLELVRNGETGLLQAYLCDEEFEKFVAVPETNFTMMAKLDGREERAEFVRVLNTESGGTNESWTFEARAEWVKAAAKFEGLIPSATFKGRTYTNISFPLPEGTRHTH